MAHTNVYNPPRNFIRQIIDERLDRMTEQRIRDYTRDYATDSDGKQDEEKSFFIRREVLRRSTMGRELDIYEPAQWALASFVMLSAAGLGLKAWMGEKMSGGIAKAFIASTALSSGIGLMRLQTRFEAGLRGGLDTAFSMVELEKHRREQQRDTHPQLD